MDSDLIKIFVIIFMSVIFLVAALPLRNYLEIKNLQKKDACWTRWVNELPSKEDLMQKTSSNDNQIECRYCGSSRQYPSLEMVIKNKPIFGVINNNFSKYAHFKTYICTGCGTQIYRRRYVE